MKRTSIILVAAGLLLGTQACEESAFTERYADPAKIAQTTVEKQYTGFLNSNMDYVLPAYRNYFVTLRTSINRFVQNTGWPDESGQFVPGSAGVEDVWFNYYNFLAQYRELQKVHATLAPEQQAGRRVFMLTATVYLYDYTHRMVDLFGAIPFSEAGMLSKNVGDYAVSNPKYDTPESIYTTMLDDLKSIATELNGITLNAGFQRSFQTQDFINKGSLPAWRRYTNSLRLRMLNRVSGVESFRTRANAEMADILGNAATFPVVESNTENIQVNVFDINTNINSKGFDQGLASAGWYGNTAGKKMIDVMSTTNDPRLPVLFEPGENAKGKYIGIDQMASNTVQTQLFNDGLVAIYHRYTLSRNQFFPGVIVNAAEVSLIKAEYYLRTNNLAGAKTAYEKAIDQSVKFYNSVMALSNAIGIVAPKAATDAQITAYLAVDGVNWDKAATNADKLALIANQKWLHFNVVQPYENWAEVRRLDMPKFIFQVDNANNQTEPPFRWNYPGNEVTYNTNNYNAVSAQDKLTTKIFWDQ